MDDFDSDVLSSNIWDLSLKSFEEAFEACVTSCDYDVTEKISSDVNICFSNRLHYHALYPWETLKFVTLLEQSLYYTRPLIRYLDLLAIW